MDRASSMERVRRDGMSLQHLGKELRADKEIVLAAVQQDGWSLRYADEGLKGDKDVVLEAVKRNGGSLRYASADLQDDRDVVLEAVRQWGEALRYASDNVKADREVVFEAVCRAGAGAVLGMASAKLQSDKDLALLLARDPNCPPERLKTFCQIDSSDQSFWRAVRSRIAAPGEQGMPIVSVSLSLEERGPAGRQFVCEASLLSGSSFVCLLAASGSHTADDVDGLPRPAAEDPPSGTEVCDSSLEPQGLPNATREQIEVSEGAELSGPRATVLVNDLAQAIVEKMPACSEVQAKRIFLNIVTSSEGDSRTVTPWELDRPLDEFLLGGLS